MLDPIWQNAAERRAQVQAALDYVGLTGSEVRLGQTLNAYERRLVEIGRAIVGRPRIVLMDEPGAGLSETERDELQALITGIPDRFEAVVVLIDHDVNLIAATCHSTAVLDFGSLIAYGPTRAILQDDKVKAAYLGVEASHGK
jgi:ABC-type branched-subunit amino acid transport system ATPase component